MDAYLFGKIACFDSSFICLLSQRIIAAAIILGPIAFLLFILFRPNDVFESKKPPIKRRLVQKKKR